MGFLSALRRRFLTAAEREQIAAALAGVDRYTKARIGVVIDEEAGPDPERRAEALLRRWDIPEADRASAVLLYVSAVSRTFAVVGGEEIRRVAPPAFWEILHRDLRHHFEERRYCDGMFKALAQVTAQLQLHFPPATERAAQGPPAGTEGRREDPDPTNEAG